MNQETCFFCGGLLGVDAMTPGRCECFDKVPGQERERSAVDDPRPLYETVENPSLSAEDKLILLDILNGSDH